MTKSISPRRAELLMRCVPLLRGQVRRLVVSRDLQRDLLQELILAVLSAPTCPHDTRRFVEYCRRVAFRLARGEAYLPKSDPDRTVLLSEEDLPDSVDPWGDPEQAADRREALSRAIDRLKDDALELLIRRYVLEENANELARDFLRTPAALRVRLMRLRSAARSAVR